MSRAWTKIITPEVVSFDEIMSEELARDLQAKEDQRYAEEMLKNTTSSADTTTITTASTTTNDSCESDAVIARMLQLQFDKEYDENLKRTEQKFNGKSKVSVSFDNYRRAPQNFDFESDSDTANDEIEDIRDRKDWDRFDQLQKQFNSIPSCGYKMINGNMITKHDVIMSSRKNACKLLSFPPEFQTGDGEDFDLKLSNKVFNSLKRHSQHSEQLRRHRIRDKKEDRATAEFGLDQYTKQLLYKLIEQELLDKINGIISIGKESVILHADGNIDYNNNNDDDNNGGGGGGGGNNEKIIPLDCVVKVYKTTLSEFKQRDKYIRDDYRFKDRIGNKQTSRKIINLWAEKEMHNLYRLKHANIPCPDVILLKKHLLVMSMIGDNHQPALKLKDAKMHHNDYILAYEQIIKILKDLYNLAKLVHADLSEYNILWHQQQCYIIDVSQSVMLSHISAMEFLKRDCDNITNFFIKKQIPDVYTSDELFKSITGDDYTQKHKIMDDGSSGGGGSCSKLKPHHFNIVDGIFTNTTIDGEYNFDQAWQQLQQQQQQTTKEIDLVDPPLA